LMRVNAPAKKPKTNSIVNSLQLGLNEFYSPLVYTLPNTAPKQTCPMKPPIIDITAAATTPVVITFVGFIPVPFFEERDL